MTNGPAQVDATLRLLRMLSQSDTLPPSLERVSWQHVVAFSSSHFVLQALAGPLNACKGQAAALLEAREFLTAMQAANADRNAMLLSALRGMTHALNGIDVVPCALKGAVFLATADNPQAPVPWRFMSDIDLLIPEDRLGACVAAIGKLGFTPAQGEYDPAREAHYLPLISPCGTFSIELHTRLFALGDFGLDPVEVWPDATPVPLGSAELFVPSLSHRLAHVLLHAQLHNRNHAVHRIVLKDILDLIMLDRGAAQPVDWEALLSRLDLAGSREAAAALLAVWQRLTGAQIEAAISPAAAAWADRAISRLHWPRWRTRLNLPADTMRMEVHRLQSEEGHLRRRLNLLSDPARIREVYASWSGKQRQRVWG